MDMSAQDNDNGDGAGVVEVKIESFDWFGNEDEVEAAGRENHQLVLVPVRVAWTTRRAGLVSMAKTMPEVLVGASRQL